MTRCNNCGGEGPHFVPPSLGELGFFTCEKRKEWCPEVKAKPCEHGVTPWTECELCLKSSTTSAHFKHNEQWTPRKEATFSHYRENPFGNITRDGGFPSDG